MQRVLFENLDENEFKKNLEKAEEVVAKKTKQIELLREILKYNKELHAKDLLQKKDQAAQTTESQAETQQPDKESKAQPTSTKKRVLAYPLELSGSLQYQINEPDSPLRQLIDAESLIARVLSSWSTCDLDEYTVFLQEVQQQIDSTVKQLELLKKIIEDQKTVQEKKDAKDAGAPVVKTRSLVPHLDLDGCLNWKLQDRNSRTSQLVALKGLMSAPLGISEEEQIIYKFIERLIEEEKAKQMVEDNEDLWMELALEAKEGGFSAIITTIGTNRQDKEWDDMNSSHGRGSFAPIFKKIPIIGIRRALDKIGASHIATWDDTDILANIYAKQGSSEGAARILDDEQFKTKDVVVKNPKQYTHPDHAHYICDSNKGIMEYKNLHRGDKQPCNTQDAKQYDRHVFIDDKRSLLHFDIKHWKANTDLMPKKEFSIRSWPNIPNHRMYGEVVRETIVGTGEIDPNYKQNTILLTAILLSDEYNQLFDEKAFTQVPFEQGIEGLRAKLQGYTQTEIGERHYTSEKMDLFRKHRKLTAPAVQIALANPAPESKHTEVTDQTGTKVLVSVPEVVVDAEVYGSKGKPAPQLLFAPKESVIPLDSTATPASAPVKEHVNQLGS